MEWLNKEVPNLFPAYAGVIPYLEIQKEKDKPFPRICGGDPRWYLHKSTTERLFPAYAGVILYSLFRTRISDTFPRICGGDPKNPNAHGPFYDFSPHTRG